MEVSVCYRGLHSRHIGIERIEPHGARKALDRGLRFAKPQSCITGPKPCKRQVGVELERPIEEGDTRVEVANDISQHHSRSSENERVISVQLQRPPS